LTLQVSLRDRVRRQPAGGHGVVDDPLQECDLVIDRLRRGPRTPASLLALAGAAELVNALDREAAHAYRAEVAQQRLRSTGVALPRVVLGGGDGLVQIPDVLHRERGGAN